MFWGVTELRHLVDIINQTDLVENLDGEQKLGQPMVQLTLLKDWGTLDFFAMPYFRERTFTGPDGRPRPRSPSRFSTRSVWLIMSMLTRGGFFTMPQTPGRVTATSPSPLNRNTSMTGMTVTSALSLRLSSALTRGRGCRYSAGARICE